MILAEGEQTVVGVCHMLKKVTEENTVIRQRCVAFIEDFCVHKNYQRQGMGKMLYKEAIRKSKLWETDSLELNVWEVNEEAV